MIAVSIWNYLILSGVASAALVAIGNWRYLGWICAILVAYALSVIYWDFGGPYAEFVAGVLDLAIVITVAVRAKYVWELWLGLMFLSSAFVNMVYLANNVTGAGLVNHEVYGALLEVINILALAMIGGVSSFDKAGMVNGLAFRPWLHIFGRLRPVYARGNSRS